MRPELRVTRAFGMYPGCSATADRLKGCKHEGGGASRTLSHMRCLPINNAARSFRGGAISLSRIGRLNERYMFLWRCPLLTPVKRYWHSRLAAPGLTYSKRLSSCRDGYRAVTDNRGCLRKQTVKVLDCSTTGLEIHCRGGLRSWSAIMRRLASQRGSDSSPDSLKPLIGTPACLGRLRTKRMVPIDAHRSERAPSLPPRYPVVHATFPRHLAFVLQYPAGRFHTLPPTAQRPEACRSQIRSALTSRPRHAAPRDAA